MNHIIAWHYTTGDKVKQIIESGYLKPTAIGVNGTEKPILWFSTNQVWEQTACKSVMNNGQIVRVSKEEMLILGNGLYRFGLPANKLHAWPKLAKKARMTQFVQQALEIEGRKQNADPMQWHGLTSIPLPLEKIDFIQVEDKGAWVNINNK